ncbi:phosphate acetyltransferase [Varibaculum prostatecancerukia]|uniref:phosphate acetyltransferase n=1 Tax=Varibaculum prostatecancerukia TaxID=2811781 RepID=UPI00203C0EA3|nr:phosphate acetyltransferase [Varibaculum prostatecancerukia]
MNKSYYLAPLQADTDTESVAKSLAQLLGNSPIHQVFKEGLPSPEEWILKSEQSAQQVIDTFSNAGDVLYDGTYSATSASLDITEVHAHAAAHLLAPMILLIDASGMDEEAAINASRIMALTASRHGGTPAGTILINATFTPSVGLEHAPVATVSGSKVDAADLENLRPILQNPPRVAIPPLAYQGMLTERAKAAPRTIVLPESEDDRVLQAAAQILKLSAAKIILLGEEGEVAARAQKLKLDLSGAKVVSLSDESLIERYGQRLSELRSDKGVTPEKARELLKDSAYFGTMMIECGDADGMVSGACHTTANTIRPALQIIKTKPEVSTVSGAFLMLFSDHADLYADCAVSINPDCNQLADIAASSAKTAAQFGIDPKVALISYSTGDSGSGETVTKVAEAVKLVKENHPELAVDGPLQFDAAIDRKVAATKRPDSPVAGQASVFVFNHLDVGNCVYKAVQRTAGAVAVGPILQGLNKPVNDLSRGALVADIVNTIIITAIQAQE